MSTCTLTLGQIAVDCVDAARLAAFWSALLDRPTAEGASAGMAVIPPGEGFPAMMFLSVPEPRTAKNRMHLDLVSSDHRAEAARAVALGAAHHGDFDEAGFQWSTLSDPEGNVFDIAFHPSGVAPETSPPRP